MSAEPTMENISTRGGLESFVYDDQIARMFALATLIWGTIAFLVGIIIATELAAPSVNMGLDLITFGRLRPLHTNAAIFAFVGNMIFAGTYHSTQRLVRPERALSPF